MLGHQASARGRVAGCRAPHSWRRGRDSGEAAGRPPTWSLCPRHSRVHVSGCGRTDGGTTEASSAHRSLGNWLPARPPPSGLRSGPSSVSRAAGPRGNRVPALCFGFLICRSSLGRTLCLIVLKSPLYPVIGGLAWHTPAAHIPRGRGPHGWSQAAGVEARRWSGALALSPPFKLRGRI
ncbi:unnamed protein product [Rangifer tarandus platyrhynchus]|uniref:Uncharacterized protein n=1 Tax=Rangifer tarandus platyrhynchus TaxID=3082113 RepID=A0ABN8YH61_RANTA|nr:unnamed protein product [Rangifer tarandus platyrhynchus]